MRPEIYFGIVVETHSPGMPQVPKIEEGIDTDTDDDETRRRAGVGLGRGPLHPPTPPTGDPGSIRISDLSHISKVYNDIQKEPLTMLKETLAVCEALTSPVRAPGPTLHSDPPVNTLSLYPRAAHDSSEKGVALVISDYSRTDVFIVYNCPIRAVRSSLERIMIMHHLRTTIKLSCVLSTRIEALFPS